MRLREDGRALDISIRRTHCFDILVYESASIATTLMDCRGGHLAPYEQTFFCLLG